MMFNPPITIVATTYFSSDEAGEYRREVALQTIKSWRSCLEYDGVIRLHIADDGSEMPLTDVKWWHPYADPHVSYSQQVRCGYGASMNTGFRKAFSLSSIVLHAVDDWKLHNIFNITPWVKLLLEREDIGMVRLGPPHPNISGGVEILTDQWQGWGLRLDRQSYAFGTRPALYHKRLIDAYGWFTEGVSALECERLYNEKFCSTPGPDIVLALPHPWQHLDSPSLSGMEPK